MKSKMQCQWAETSETLPRCTKMATRKWGDCWFCEEHGSRDKAVGEVLTFMHKHGDFKQARAEQNYLVSSVPGGH